MSNKIIQLNEGIVKKELKELVRSSVEETLNRLLEQGTQQFTNAAKYEGTHERQGYQCHHHLWGVRYHRATISELNKKTYVHIEDWRSSPLKGGKYPYVYVDGIYLWLNREVRRRTRVLSLDDTSMVG